jgi:transposase
MIAQFCQTQQPGAWTPPAPHILELRGLLSYRQELVEQRTRIGQIAGSIEVSAQLGRLHTKHLKVLNDTIVVIEGQLRDALKANRELSTQVATLESVEGFGFLTAATIVAKLPVERLRDGKAAAAYVGLTPKDRQSGTSVKGKPHICKTGDGTLRRDLYMPAMVAMRCNPILAAFSARLRERGKAPKVIIVAVMRKLIVLAFNLLKELSLTKSAVTA